MKTRSPDSGSIQRMLDVGVVVAALLTVPLIVAQENGGSDDPLLVAGDWIVWLIFLAQYVTTIALPSERWRCARRDWFSLAVILLSFPAFPGLLALIRLTRLARLFRMLRLTSVVWRGSQSLRVVFGRRGLINVCALCLGLVVAGGGLMSALEPETVKGDFGGGVWWAIVTATTVGYGDIAPVTPMGRMLAVGLMLGGIGLTSTLAASVAAYFIGQDQTAETKDLEKRLERIEAMLEKSIASNQLQPDDELKGSSRRD